MTSMLAFIQRVWPSLSASVRRTLARPQGLGLALAGAGVGVGALTIPVSLMGAAMSTDRGTLSAIFGYLAGGAVALGAAWLATS